MTKFNYSGLMIVLLLTVSCVSKKSFTELQTDLDAANEEIAKYQDMVTKKDQEIAQCNSEKESILGQLRTSESNMELRQEQLDNFRDQVDDLRKQRDEQATQITDLTVLTKSANDNISETLSQLERRDEYIHLLQAAKSKTDSINLALAVNLKTVLRDGILDEDVEVKVDKTVVFINLSDKMLYRSGSAEITPAANDILGKIAQIVESKPGLEVMVEGYTDNNPISRDCFEDNWDLSVKRATSVVRVLQEQFNIDPNRMIAAGRGEYNTLASNDTAEGRATNRRTRIIILPKMGEFYDLLEPTTLN